MQTVCIFPNAYRISTMMAVVLLLCFMDHVVVVQGGQVKEESKLHSCASEVQMNIQTKTATSMMSMSEVHDRMRIVRRMQQMWNSTLPTGIRRETTMEEGRRRTGDAPELHPPMWYPMELSDHEGSEEDIFDIRIRRIIDERAACICQIFKIIHAFTVIAMFVLFLYSIFRMTLK